MVAAQGNLWALRSSLFGDRKLQLSRRMMNRICGLFLTVLGMLELTAAGNAEELVRREWTVEGVTREALMHVPSGAAHQATPVVFVFHGHGGSMRQVAQANPIHQNWPEAIVVYPQGLPTAGRLTDPTGNLNGWQAGPGDQGDRYLKFFDAMQSSLGSDYQIDPKRIYATGHSNGGSFVYLLWAKRGDGFAALGPAAAIATPTDRALLPRPVIHIAGEKDTLVKFAWQTRMIESLRRTNQCGDGRLLSPGCTLYASKIGAPVMTYIYPGGHPFPPEATALIVEFFKHHPKA